MFLRYILAYLLFSLTTLCLAQKVLPRRLITIGSAVSETVCALDHCDDIIAVDSTSQYPAALKKRATLGYYRSLSIEGILSKRPDMIIAADDIKPPAVASQLKKTGITLHLVDNSKTLAGALQRIKAIGSVLKENARANTLVAGIKKQMKLLKSRVDKMTTKPKVLFIYARGANQLQVAGRDTAAATMISLSGGVPIFNEFSGYKPLTEESLVKANPDIVVLTDRGAGSIGNGIKGLENIPGMKLTKAGREQRYVTIDDVLFLGFGPRIGLAVETLYEAIK